MKVQHFTKENEQAVIGEGCRLSSNSDSDCDNVRRGHSYHRRSYHLKRSKSKSRHAFTSKSRSRSCSEDNYRFDRGESSGRRCNDDVADGGGDGSSGSSGVGGVRKVGISCGVVEGPTIYGCICRGCQSPDVEIMNGRGVIDERGKFEETEWHDVIDKRGNFGEAERHNGDGERMGNCWSLARVMDRLKQLLRWKSILPLLSVLSGRPSPHRSPAVVRAQQPRSTNHGGSPGDPLCQKFKGNIKTKYRLKQTPAFKYCTEAYMNKDGIPVCHRCSSQYRHSANVSGHLPAVQNPSSPFVADKITPLEIKYGGVCEPTERITIGTETERREMGMKMGKASYSKNGHFEFPPSINLSRSALNTNFCACAPTDNGLGTNDGRTVLTKSRKEPSNSNTPAVVSNENAVLTYTLNDTQFFRTTEILSKTQTGVNQENTAISRTQGVNLEELSLENSALSTEMSQVIPPFTCKCSCAVSQFSADDRLVNAAFRPLYMPGGVRDNSATDRMVGLTIHCLLLSLLVMGVLLARWAIAALRFLLYLGLHTAIYRGRVAPLREDASEPVTKSQLKDATVFDSTGLKIVLLQYRPPRVPSIEGATSTTFTETSHQLPSYGNASYNSCSHNLRSRGGGGEGRDWRREGRDTWREGWRAPTKSVSNHSASSQDVSHIFSSSTS